MNGSQRLVPLWLIVLITLHSNADEYVASMEIVVESWHRRFSLDPNINVECLREDVKVLTVRELPVVSVALGTVALILAYSSTKMA